MAFFGSWGCIRICALWIENLTVLRVYLCKRDPCKDVFKVGLIALEEHLYFSQRLMQGRRAMLMGFVSVDPVYNVSGMVPTELP